MIPQWDSTASLLTAPPAALLASGYAPGNTIAAQHYNYQFYHLTREMNNVLAAAGITPAGGTDNQLLTSLYALITVSGTAAFLTSSNPTLRAGQYGIETDTLYVKLGDGSTAWNSLPYYQVSGTAAALASKNPVLRSGGFGYETNTISFKLGDGSTAYNSLTYVYGGVIKPLSGTVSGNTTYNTIPNVAGTHIIYIPAAYLVAASGGPWTLTLGTGSGTTVVVPIAAAGDTLLSGALLFNVYVDGSGNVTSDFFEVQGGNSSGQWIKSSTGKLDQYSNTGAFVSTGVSSFSFPVAFIGGTVTVTCSNYPTGSHAIAEAWAQNLSTLYCYALSGNNVEWHAIGRWR